MYFNIRNLRILKDNSLEATSVRTQRIHCNEGIIDEGVQGDSILFYKVGEEWWREKDKLNGYRGYISPEFSKIFGGYEPTDKRSNNLFRYVCGK